jgi:hypothetical protein
VSEHFGEAFIFIRPDVTKFREELLLGLKEATRGVKVTVPVQGVGTAAKASTQQLTASTKAAGAAAAELTAQEAQLAQATSLAAAAQEKLVAVESAGEFATTALAESKAKLRAAELAVVSARKANEAALTVENAELRANTAATLASAEAEFASARAAALEGVAHAKASGEVAAHAAAEHSLVSGARAAGVSLTGLRGATLATSGAFLAGAVAVKLLEESIHEAAAEQAAAARTEHVLGEESKALEADSKDLADTFGLSAAEALNFESKLANLLTTAGATQKVAAGLSEELLKTAADVAAFQGVKVDKVLQAFQLGLVGNSRGLRQFQIELNQARVNAVALRESGKDNVKQLSALDKELARAHELLRQTANQQGAAARNADQFSQKEKVAKAELANLGGTIGRAVLPKVSELLTEVTLLIKGLGLLGDAAEKGFAKLGDAIGQSDTGRRLQKLADFFNPTGSPLKKFQDAKDAFNAVREAIDPKDVNRDWKELNFQGQKFSGTMEELHQKAVDLFAQKSIDDFNTSILETISRVDRLIRKAGDVSFKNAEASLDRMNEKLTDIKIAGGPGEQGNTLAALQAQVPDLQSAIAAQEAAARATIGKAGHATAIARRRQLKQELADVLDQIRSINKDIAQGAIDAAQQIADDAQKAADLVQKLLDDADQAFLTAIGLEQGNVGIRQTIAEGTKSLNDDIAAQQLLQKTLLRERAQAAKTISNLTLRAQTIQGLTQAYQQSVNDEKALHEAQKQAALELKQRIQAERESSLDSDIEFAQINKNRGAEIRAHQAKIKFLIDLQNHTKRGTAEWKKLRNEIAQERKAIKDLRGEADKARADLLAMEFEFLQTQSGFAANVLSNILPASTIAGTVGGGISTPAGLGGGATAAQVKVPAADFATAVHKRPQAASATAQGGRGATAGQMSQLIHIQTQTLHVMMRLVGQGTHPEATHQRRSVAVSMDTV